MNLLSENYLISDMNKDFNLYEILKGHEGETFYSPIYGDVHINFGVSGDNENVLRMYPAGEFSCYLPVSPNGYHFDYSNSGEMIIFPSKDQRDWNKWIEEQEPKVPKTWSEFVEKDNRAITYNLEVTYNEYQPHSTSYTPIEKSALALLKINQLIEVGYGGNVTNEDWKNPYLAKYDIIPDTAHSDKLCVRCVGFVKSVIAFYTKEQAEEFLSKPENVQLLKDYFMIL